MARRHAAPLHRRISGLDDLSTCSALRRQTRLFGDKSSETHELPSRLLQCCLYLHMSKRDATNRSGCLRLRTHILATVTANRERTALRGPSMRTLAPNRKPVDSRTVTGRDFLETSEGHDQTTGSENTT